MSWGQQMFYNKVQNIILKKYNKVQIRYKIQKQLFKKVKGLCLVLAVSVSLKNRITS